MAAPVPEPFPNPVDDISVWLLAIEYGKYQQLPKLVSRLVMSSFRVIVVLYLVRLKPLWWLCEELNLGVWLV